MVRIQRCLPFVRTLSLASTYEFRKSPTVKAIIEPRAMRQPPPKQVSSAGWSWAEKGSSGLMGMASTTQVMRVAKAIAAKPVQITLRVSA